MVTVYYLRRFFVYFKSLLFELDKDNIAISNEVLDWFQGVYTALNKHRSIIDEKVINPKKRMDMSY